MKRFLFIPGLFLKVFLCIGQLHIETILPDKPIIVNEPFRIQFVIQNPDNDQHFEAPDFKNIRIIGRPEKYAGTQSINGKKVPIANYVYTLVSSTTGDFQFAPAIVTINGSVFTGDDFGITIYSKKETRQDRSQGFSEYTLRADEDPYKKIRENLFVKIIVNKQTCYVGQPVVATFKLFSRLQSKSDIVKNPGFYGFSVYDMINLDDKVKETERINGKEFDVHTIRKVQLYPLQPGEYMIDELKIENKVEFSRSVVNKKTEQEISEGVLKDENENDSFNPGSEVFETTLVTEPVKIKVNPLPGKKVPDEFNGATGYFTIHATTGKKALDKNEEGFLILTIEGKGNFTQLTAPLVQWPKELEGFEPSIKDFLDRHLVPLSGARIFRYPFISSQPGKWKIPPITFSFFNTNSNSYQTISSDSVLITISNREYKKPETEKIIHKEKKSSIEETNRRVSLIAFSIIILLIIGAVSYWLLAGKRKKIIEEPAAKKSIQSIDGSFDTFRDDTISEKEFYRGMHQTIWSYLGETFNLSGTEMNKSSLINRVRENANSESISYELLELINYFETAMFTNINVKENRAELIDRTKSILKELKT